ncbi:LysR family transcriptional regulator [Pseudomonas sp. GX19020]|uniref:LysR family transcriptional regulator n=1 Tax=Pseudomonas sp. GX19020 TaxID=2942277 RepID=UPI00201A104D|nr:LysR family transcriptional regulator [Pseudomonas sp. GX19020]MCL4065374.1 LysR family transcriptional regulator [Pseudomonas sp. GX19020]
MDRRRLPLNALRAFEEVALQGSFRAAADSLNVAQSSLSRHVATLEHAAGVSLFERHPRGIELTPAAEKLLSSVRKSFDRLSLTLDEIGAQSTEMRVLRIYFAPSFASLLAVSALKDFRQLCPGITLDISCLTLPQHQSNPPDAAVIYSRPIISDKVINLLWQVESTLICHPDLVSEGPLDSSEALDSFLSRNELLHVRVDDGDRFSLWKQFAGVHGLRGTVARGLTFDTAELAIRYAQNGNGIALLDPTPFRPEIASGNLICPSPLRLTPGYGYYLVCDAEALEDTAVALFRNWLIQQFCKSDREAGQ